MRDTIHSHRSLGIEDMGSMPGAQPAFSAFFPEEEEARAEFYKFRNAVDIILMLDPIVGEFTRKLPESTSKYRAEVILRDTFCFITHLTSDLKPPPACYSYMII